MRTLLDLFYPDLCPGCEQTLVRAERFICITCIQDLPRTRFHSDRENQVEKVFWGKVDIQAATAFLYFSKGGKVQRFLHELKYRMATGVGSRLGELLGEELKELEPFKTVDAIVPVPLHRSKLRKRGFNQAEMIALGMSTAMNRPMHKDLLERIEATSTQTKRSRYDRWGNVSGVFATNGNVVGQHLLLVDDVLTTGATIGSCAEALTKAGGRVSIATLATA